MRRIGGFLVLVVLLGQATQARAHRDWEHAERLKHGSFVEIWLWSGHIVGGWVNVVSDAGLQLTVMKEIDSGKLDFNRADIREIILVRTPFMGRHYDAFQDAMIVTAVAGVAVDVVEIVKNPNGPRVAGVVAVAAGVALLSVWLARNVRPRRVVVYEDPLGARSPLAVNLRAHRMICI